MIRYFRWASKHTSKVPRLSSETMIPDSLGKLSDTDLIRMYDLRMYHISTNPFSRFGDKYVPELERLHRELNHRMSVTMLGRWSFVLCLLYFLYIWMDGESGENRNWHTRWHLVQQWSVFEELSTGGEEGDEPSGV